MNDEYKSRSELIEELTNLRKRLADAEDRKISHRDLPDTGNMYDTLVEGSMQGVVIAHPNPLQLSFANNSMKNLTGFEAVELTEMSEGEILKIIHPEDRARLFNNFEQHVAGKKKDKPEEYRIICKDNRVKWLQTFSSTINYEGKPGTLTTFIDITERKETEKALKDAQKFLEAAVSQSPSGILIADAPDVKIRLVNQTAMDILNGENDPEALIKNKKWKLLQTDGTPYPEEEQPLFRAVKSGEIVQNEEFIIYDQKGELHWCNANASPIRSNAGEIIAGVLVINDITESKQMEDELRKSKEFAEHLVETANVLIVTLNTNANITTFNKYAEEMTGYRKEEVIGQNWFDIFIPDRDRDKIPAVFKDALNDMPDVAQYENPIILKNGEERLISWSNNILRGGRSDVTGLLCIGMDITASRIAEKEKSRLEARLRRSQKLETIGTLAGGIAHDFNNILTPIMGYTDMALQNMDKDNPLFKDLQSVQRGVYRAQNLIEQILLFSKLTNTTRKPLSLQNMIKESLKLLRPSIPTTIDIQIKIDHHCPRVHADPTQIHQVIINICTNAWQAMEATGGTLSIDLTSVYIDETMNKQFPNLTEGNYARLSIIDNGPGMSEKIQERIFEPFFTTKPVDKGTGLGLSVVHGIITSHNGDIQVYSEAGKGTIFNIYLPVIQSHSKTEICDTVEIIGGNETVMVVDDEEEICRITKMMLESYGYKVETYKNGLDALDAFTEAPYKYDLLISDLTMPYMTGVELSSRIHGMREELPIIIITGFGDNLINRSKEELGIKQIICKPITLKEMAISVRKILDQK